MTSPAADETANASDTPDYMVPPSRMVCTATISNILTNTKVTTFGVPATTSTKGNDILGVRMCNVLNSYQRVGRICCFFLRNSKFRDNVPSTKVQGVTILHKLIFNQQFLEWLHGRDSSKYAERIFRSFKELVWGNSFNINIQHISYNGPPHCLLVEVIQLTESFNFI